jgi:hypothetical protein
MPAIAEQDAIFETSPICADSQPSASFSIQARQADNAALETVPAVALEADDPKAKTLALLENLQREDLTPYEETLGILDLLGLQLAKEPKEVVSLLYRLRDESRKKVPHNVMGNFEGSCDRRKHCSIAAWLRLL